MKPSPPFSKQDMAERHIPVKMNHLCCRICRNLLRNPATVPCGHNFCMKCIQDRWDREELKNSLCRCPECDYEFPCRPQLIRNTTLAEVVRDTERSYSKKKEEEQQQQCSEGPQQVPKRPRSCTETLGSTLCKRHNKPLDVYCCTDQQIICAQCTSAEHGGHRIGWVKEERRNTTLAEVVRDTERSYSKKKEEEQQQQCSEGPQQVPKRPRSCTETLGSTLCKRHNKPLDVYCCTDQQIICAQCTSAEHGGHRIGWVKEERRRKQEELKSMQAKFEETFQKQERKRKMMGEMLGQIQDEARQTEDFCESVIVGVIDSLQKHYLSVKERIVAQEEAAATQVRVSLQSLEVKMKEMKKRDAELDLLAQTESNIHFLQKWSSLKLICERLCSFREASEDPLLPFELTKRAVEHLGRQLDEFCDKEFASICQTADGEEQLESSSAAAAAAAEEEDIQQRCEASNSHPCVSWTLAEQNVEPKTREEFLQYACELSLDPTTAHQDLAISEGEKEVMLYHPRSKNPGVHYPERFIHRLQVLCREGLHGNCYYEVEVKGDKAEIALAYKGIDRKSRTERSAFGANTNSWSLDCSKNYSVSHNSESILLTTSPSHHRIGVYLQFQKGTLSFYEVSGSMKFLYKAEAKFREPLYPGFWLGENCCIRICDLRQNRL